MKISLVDTDLALLEPLIKVDRSPGLHLSEVINSLANEAGVDSYGSHSGPPTLRMQMGFLWEDLLSMALKERLPLRMDGIEKDGIHMSPDGMDNRGHLWEYKATWKSSRSDPADNWRWMTQTKCYSHALGTQVVNLSVFYVNGDYKDSGPQSFLYLVEFGLEEQEENWAMIVNHARRKGMIP